MPGRYADDVRRRGVCGSGAAGRCRRILLKDLPARELADAVRLARSGIAQFDVQAAGRLASALARHPLSRPEGGDNTGPGQVGPSLTAREVDVLRLIACGATNREIAAQLFLSEGTVKNHISRILSRIGLRDRTQAAIYARDRGLL